MAGGKMRLETRKAFSVNSRAFGANTVTKTDGGYPASGAHE
jgi:hypothetical protein